jgi:V/A-type H+/Na+-transporting ATPase subunit E
MSKAAIDTLGKVAEEFEAEVVADLEQGRMEALARVEAARKETADAVSKILETSVKQAESVKRQVIGAAELEVRNDQLKSMERAVNHVFEAATKEVTELSGVAHEKALARLIEEGLEVIGPSAVVYCSSKDSKAVSASLKSLGHKLKMGEDSIETMGGVVLASPDGSIRFDNTFEARLERMRPELRKEVAGVLTG